MNRKNVQLLRDTLAEHYLKQEGIKFGKERLGFNMAYVVERTSAELEDKLDECGTSCCLIGWVRALRVQAGELDAKDARLLPGPHGNGFVSETEWLGLDRWGGSELFQPLTEFYKSKDFWPTITVPETILVLDHLLATGVVDWQLVVRRREQIERGGYVPVSPAYGRPEKVAPPPEEDRFLPTWNITLNGRDDFSVTSG